MQQRNIQPSAQIVPIERRQANSPTAYHILSGSTLKLIAVITMLIDHFAAGVLGRYLSMRSGNGQNWNDMAAYEQWMEQNEMLMNAYRIMRDIGRVAFPIYCFLLVEGFMHTKNRVKYAGRLFIFAFISEIPFDLLFKGNYIDFSYQNVFFTLFFGMLAMAGMERAAKLEHMPLPLKAGLACLAAGICMAIADAMATDYGARGVLCIAIMYLFRRNRELQIAMGGCSFLFFLDEMAAPYAFISIALYNGKRGWNMKYFFYLFYPVHLLLLYLLGTLLGIASYPSW